jgi:molecular chaperone HscB
VQLERNTAMPPEFLMKQMEWRETVEEVRSSGDSQAMEDLHRRIKKEIAEQFERLKLHLDLKPDYQAAAATVRQMMFQEKLLQEIDDALVELEA